MELGRGIADVLTGRVSPAGRLAQTWYGKDFKYPDINDYDIKKNHMTYIYADKPVLYPFGHGLSYTTFEYSDPEIKAGVVSFTIRNTGSRASDEVWQAYSLKGGRRLIAFGRQSIAAGESVRICFEAVSGEILIGASSEDIRLRIQPFIG